MYFTSPSRTARPKRRTPAPLTTERITTMISDFLNEFAAGSSGVITTGSDVIDLFAGLPAQLVNLFAGALEGIGS